MVRTRKDFFQLLTNYCNFAYSAFASFNMEVFWAGERPEDISVQKLATLYCAIKPCLGLPILP